MHKNVLAMTVVMTMSMMLGSARGQLGESGVRFKGLRPAQITQVPIGGGGAVTYLAQHPQEPDIKYLVADVAGLHRWNPPSQSWTPLHDAFGPDNVRGMHGELVAIHPTNPQLLVYSAGTRWATGPYALYRSTDGGQTWSDPITLAGTDGKPTYITNGGTGHRLVFDPHHGQTIYYGSRRDGLFRSDDAGLTWRPIDLLPRENTAINFVQFDPTTGGPDGSRVLYVGLSRASDDGADVEAGIYRSTDGGTSFHKLFVPPRPEAFGTVDHQGNLFLHRGRLLRWTREQLQAGDFTPQDLTPPLAAGRTLYSVDIDPNDPNRLITGTIDGGDPGGLFYSRDGGKTWRSWMNHRRTGQGEPFTVTGMQPYDPDFGWVFACMHQATFDRADPRRAFFTGWYTIGAVDDLDAERVTIRQLYQGIEMTCIWDLICPPQGAPLISGLMDLGGFVHDRVDELPASYLRGMGPAYAPDANPQDVNDLDFCEADPSVVVATIGWRDSGDIGAAGYSTDGGKTWRQFPTLPFDGAKNGRIAISATNPDRIVFVPRAPAKVYFTHDRGKTWQESKGGPADIVFGEFVYTFYMPLGSDRVDGSFYLYDRRDGRFFRSEDGAAFEPVSTLPRQSGIHTDRHVIKAMPHAAGHVFAALNEEGLHRSTDGGRSWTKLDGVARAWALGFGRIDDSNRQAVYIVGRLSDDNAVAPTRVAVYRSDDLGESWVRLNEPDAPGLAQCITLEGDQQTPGRIYIGENGRGIWRFDETK